MSSSECGRGGNDDDESDFEDYELAVDLFVSDLLDSLVGAVDVDDDDMVDYDGDVCGIDFIDRAPYDVRSENDDDEDDIDLPRSLCDFFQPEDTASTCRTSTCVRRHGVGSVSETSIRPTVGAVSNAKRYRSVPTIVITKHFDDDDEVTDRIDDVTTSDKRVSWTEDQAGDGTSVGHQRDAASEQCQKTLRVLKDRVLELEKSSDDKMEAAFQSGIGTAATRLAQADRMVSLLQDRVASLMNDRQCLLNYIEEAEQDFLVAKERLTEELVAKRYEVTRALTEKLNLNKKLGKTFRCDLLAAKHKSDDMMDLMVEKDRKIRDMAISARRQHSYQMLMEEEIANLQVELAHSEGQTWPKKPVFPCRAAGEEHVYSQMADLLNVSDGDYRRGNDHNPDIATTNFMAYEARRNLPDSVSERKVRSGYNPTKLAYYRGMGKAAKLLEQIERLQGLSHCSAEQRARAMLSNTPIGASQ